MTSRKLSANEKKAITTFVKTLKVHITPWQPSDSQQEIDIKRPTEVAELLLTLLPKSINDHLLSKYLPHLNKDANQDTIFYWLQSINNLSSNMKCTNKFKNEALVNQVLFREATRLAIGTSMSFATHTLNVMAKLPYLLSPEVLMKLTLVAIERFNEQRSNDIRAGKDKEATGAYGFYYETFIDSETLRDQLLAKQPALIRFDPQKLHRTRSDSAAVRHIEGANVVSPLRPYQPIDKSKIRPIKMPQF